MFGSVWCSSGHHSWPYIFCFASIHILNDLPEIILYSSVKLFADDCILYKAIHTHDDVEKLQEDLSAFQDWQQKWLMKLNVSKCYVMTVSHPRRNKIPSSYKINNHILSFVNHHKYLGITIQNDLKWHQHIQSITCKANETPCLINTEFKNSIHSVKRKSLFQSSTTKT